MTFSRLHAMHGWFCIVALAGFMLTGCRFAPHRDHGSPYDLQEPGEPYPLLEKTTTSGLAAGLEKFADAKPRTKPLHILAVCAGGVNSPFNAGALVGWTQNGTRPKFDVVTGTSSGGLVGAFAFVGPKYDARLEALFTGLKTSDLFQIRPVRYLLRDGAIASPKPLEKILEAEFNECYLADLREAHAEGRRLFIGTTNAETKRLVIWDLGAIASSGRPDAGVLVRKILQATVTWPGVLPPVEIDVLIDGRWCREQHFDGGATAQCFVRVGASAGWPAPDEGVPGWMAGSKLYVLAGGRLYESPAPPPTKFIGRILNGTSCMISTMARADMHRLHTLCMSSGMRFHLLALPHEHPRSDQGILKIDPSETRRLFDVGYRMMTTAPPWRHTPPGAEPGEEEVPRGALAGFRAAPCVR